MWSLSPSPWAHVGGYQGAAPQQCKFSPPHWFQQRVCVPGRRSTSGCGQRFSSGALFSPLILQVSSSLWCLWDKVHPPYVRVPSLGWHVGSHKQTVKIYWTDVSNGSIAAESCSQIVKSLVAVLSCKISAIGNSNLILVNYQNLGEC